MKILLLALDLFLLLPDLIGFRVIFHGKHGAAI